MGWGSISKNIRSNNGFLGYRQRGPIAYSGDFVKCDFRASQARSLGKSANRLKMEARLGKQIRANMRHVERRCACKRKRTAIKGIECHKRPKKSLSRRDRMLVEGAKPGKLPILSGKGPTKRIPSRNTEGYDEVVEKDTECLKSPSKGELDSISEDHRLESSDEERSLQRSVHVSNAKNQIYELFSREASENDEDSIVVPVLVIWRKVEM